MCVQILTYGVCIFHSQPIALDHKDTYNLISIILSTWLHICSPDRGDKNKIVTLEPGALEYESDGYMPTGERKQGAFGVGFRRKKGVIGCWIPQNWASFGVNFPKQGVIWCKFCQI